MLDLRPVLFINGLMLAMLGTGMLVPALIDLYFANPDWLVFMAAAATSLFVAGALIMTQRGTYDRLTTRQAFLLTVAAWIILPAFGALPFAYSAMGISYADAYFEAMSGLTTTGATIIVGLDTAPPGILMWRAILSWLGGVGIIVMAVAVLPMLQVAGYQLFKTESSDNSEKIIPRVTQLVGAISTAYGTLTALCILLLWGAGMSFFEAVAHGFATLSTGGFSTSDASIAHFNSPVIDVILCFFMLCAGLPFVLIYQALIGRPHVLFRDSQVRFYLGVLAFLVCMMWAWLLFFQDMEIFRALRYASFNVIAVVTGTGFASTDYSLWGTFAFGAFFLMTFMGGCAGSSAGGIKMFRFRILFSMAQAQMRRLLQPSGVFLARYNGRPVPASTVGSVMSFLFLFVVSFLMFTIGLLAMGLDLVTAASGAASALANVGPGLGDIIGPAGNYQPLPDSAKWLLSFAMMMGRLELMTVLILFTPSFWRA